MEQNQNYISSNVVFVNSGATLTVDIIVLRSKMASKMIVN